ncbi:hypothetical protein UPYG_G00132770 [Umbra pygmaea]|uniref:Histone-lysine N-methyltransferase PRDM9-like n=1 Tax=Umbra pygmaea TaxID=75934 RepID=A0ABD0WXY4_UMBPY
MSEERIVLEWTETDFPSAVVLDSLVHKTMARTEVQCQECHPLHTKDLCCEECLGSDESECDIQDNLAFMVDSPTPMGVPQRALLTLPHGLVVGRSSISGAGLGVLNQGPALPPGMHFGPFEGEECTRDRAIGSFYSWEFLNSKGESEYIDASRDSHSNWMRYVNCARNKKEGNLTALQHSGVIFFHCCRSILSGDELLFWPGGQFTDRFEDPSDQIWLRKRTSSELSTDLQYPVFLCHQCQLSFTTESYLERHTKHSHYLDQSLTEPASPFSNDVMEKDHEVSLADCSPNSLTQKGHIQRPMHTVHFKGKLPTNTQKDEASEPPTEATTIQIQVDEASEKPNSCSQCGKIFKQKSHVLRHIRGVHSDVRPYCCPQCNKGFAQKYDLARHQTQVHGKKKKWIRAVAEVRRESRALGRPPSERLRIRRLKSSSTSGANAAQQSPSRTMNSTYSDSTSDALDVEETDGVGGEDQYTCTECQRSYGNPESLEVHHCILSRAKPPFSCSTCGVTFKRYITLKKHKLSKHPKQRLTFGCTHCGRFFSRDAGLQRHLKTEVCKDIQLSSETFTCSDCHYSFTEERHLQKHVRRHHPNEYVAVMCAGLIPPQPNGEKEGCHCVQCGKSYKSCHVL